MELHEQLTSPELSNKLHQLGVTVPSIFWRDWTGSKSDELEWAKNFEAFYCEDNVNCYSVAELAQMLPRHIEVVSRYRDADRYKIQMRVEDRFLEDEDRTLADAYAKMIVYLIKNKRIEV